MPELSGDVIGLLGLLVLVLALRAPWEGDHFERPSARPFGRRTDRPQDPHADDGGR